MIGPFAFDARCTEDQKAALKPALEETAAIIGDRLTVPKGPILLVPKAAQDMPDYDPKKPGIQPAYGLWKGYSEKRGAFIVNFWERVTEYRSRPTIQHEFMHAYDEIYLSDHPEIRKACMELMHPKPDQWFWPKGTAWGTLTYECYCVYGSAALFDILRPPYSDLLNRWVYKEDWTAFGEALLA